MSEKVKEIKEKLQEEIFIANSFGDKLRKVPTKELENLLTLINELESENKELRVVVDIANERTYRKKFTDEWRKEYQKELDKQGNGHIAGHPDFDLVYKLYFEQKDRIAELEKENKSKTDTITDLLKNQEFYETEKLKQFAERLKEEFIKSANIQDSITAKKLFRDICPVKVDKVLKKFIKEK